MDQRVYAKRMERIARSILMVGICTALLIFVFAPTEADEVDFRLDVASLNTSKVYRQSVERIAGGAGVLGEEMGDFLASLWHGRRLAGCVFVISLVGAGIALGLARHPPLD